MEKIFTVITLLAFASSAYARDTISIVGSSTVFPYATIGAERFSEEGYNGATIEPTGTGGGMKLFCGGLGTNFPDITNASRPMKAKEAKLCLDNGVTDVIEVVLGNDGLTFSNSVDADRFSLKKEHIFLAMAAEVPVDGKIVTNPYTTWNEIDSSYPEYKIEVLVAPPTSGTIEMGENDTLIVQKLSEDSERFGYFGYSFLSANQDKIQGSIIDGVEPTMETIQSYEYPNARPLFFYIKKAHIGVVPGIQEYALLMVSDDAIGEEGYLTEYGLAPMTEDLTDRTIEAVEELSTMDLQACADKKHPLKELSGFGSACK